VSFALCRFFFSLTSEVFEQKKLEFQSNKYVQHSVRGDWGAGMTPNDRVLCSEVTPDPPTELSTFRHHHYTSHSRCNPAASHARISNSPRRNLNRMRGGGAQVPCLVAAGDKQERWVEYERTNPNARQTHYRNWKVRERHSCAISTGRTIRRRCPDGTDYTSTPRSNQKVGAYWSGLLRLWENITQAMSRRKRAVSVRYNHAPRFFRSPEIYTALEQYTAA
jgi:hypothetical protein